MQPIRLPLKDYTTENPITVTEDTAIDELMMLMEGAGVRHLPVVGQGQVVGIISDRDIRLFAGLSDAEKYQVNAGEIMSPNPLTLSSTTPLEEVALIMSEKKVGSIIVVEEDQLYGIFTATDALNALIEVIRKDK
ncbi:CBS domain-containing protein [Marinospirillum minutulum]|uniref:CBS domain-containing protein n=1 Tax=Marinospirillum minutulum TaxID=64974 RepID=UPI0004095587|nr:CBS domain-containing protein [Marinospirillum minutulum]